MTALTLSWFIIITTILSGAYVIYKYKNYPLIQELVIPLAIVLWVILFVVGLTVIINHYFMVNNL
jgi:hypothetical protein